MTEWIRYTVIAAVVAVLLVILIVIIVKSSKKNENETAPEAEHVEGEQPVEVEASVPEEETAVEEAPVQEEEAVAEAEPVSEEEEEPESEEEEEEEGSAEDVEVETPSEDKEKKTVKSYHISKRKSDGMWQIKLAGGKKAIKLFRTQQEAIDYCKVLAENQDAKVTVHKKDGSFRKQNY